VKKELINKEKQMKFPIPYRTWVEYADLINMFSETSEDWMLYSKSDLEALFSLKIDLFSKPFMKLVSSGKSIRSTSFYMLKLSANDEDPEFDLLHSTEIYSLKYHVDNPGAQQFETMIRNSTRLKVLKGLLKLSASIERERKKISKR
jgi:hypothetical protein